MARVFDPPTRTSVENPSPGKVVVSFKLVKLFYDHLKLNAVGHAHKSYIKNSFFRNKKFEQGILRKIHY